MTRKSNISSVLRLKHNKDSNSKPELECHSVLFSHIAPSLLSRDCKRYDDIIIEKDRPTFELRFLRHINMIYEKIGKFWVMLHMGYYFSTAPTFYVTFFVCLHIFRICLPTWFKFTPQSTDVCYHPFPNCRGWNFHP